MFLGFNKPYFLGIDFGTSLIKAVELTVEKGNPKLVKYGQVDLSRLEKGIVTGSNSYDDEVTLYLRALLEKFHPKSDGVYAAMPAFTGLISLIDFPEMSEEDLKEAIQFEAHKYVPSSLSDVSLSWEVVGIRRAEGAREGVMEILLVAALNKEVARYQQYIQNVGKEMNFLELETFSLARSIVGRDPGVFLVLDIGSRATNLILIDDGLVRVSSNLDVGGTDITRTLVDALGITADRAEALKKSDKDFLNQREAAMVFPALEMIGSESRRMLAGYHAKHPEKDCQSIILSGGTAQMTGVVAYYERLFGVPVSVGDPWRRVSYDPDLGDEIKRLGTSFSVALGLALSGVDELTHKKEPMIKKPFSLKALLTKKI